MKSEGEQFIAPHTFFTNLSADLDYAMAVYTGRLFVLFWILEEFIMDWLLGSLLPTVSLAIVGVLDGNLMFVARVIQADGEVLHFDCPIPLEDIKFKLQEGLNAKTK